jgi:glycerol-3-phosphate cytidylyltransferase
MSSTNLKKLTKGLTASSFDLLHAGHIQMLEDAKSECDYLICALQTDPSVDRPEKNKPIQSLYERYIQLRAVRWVDDIIPYTTEEELLQLTEIIHPDVRIIGEEYKEKDFTGKDYCQKNGIHIYYNRRQHALSTSDLRKRVANGQKT